MAQEAIQQCTESGPSQHSSHSSLWEGCPFTMQQISTAERYKRPSIIRDKLLHRLNMTGLHNGSVNNKCLILRGKKKARQWGKSARTSL